MNAVLLLAKTLIIFLKMQIFLIQIFDEHMTLNCFELL